MRAPRTQMLEKVNEFVRSIATSFELSENEFEFLDQLGLDMWDVPGVFQMNMCMVIFARTGGPNPMWTRFCKSKKMIATTTADGWMDLETKKLWYATEKLQADSMFADKNISVIDQRDQHYSNEDIEHSEVLIANTHAYAPCPGRPPD